MKITFIAALLFSTGAAVAQSPLSLDDPEVKTIVQKVVRAGFSDQAIIALLNAQRDTDRTAASRAINRIRTDLQTGASSDAPRSASVLEKPGIPDLLSLALDRGAITKSAAGTGLTLSTTPYAIETGFGAADTPQRFEHARLARSVSLSGTFSSTDVTKGDFSSFTSAELKYVALGNRSPRDRALMDRVRPAMAEAFLKGDVAFESACRGVLDHGSYKTVFESLSREYAKLNGPTDKQVIDLANAQLGRITAPADVMQQCFAALPGVGRLSAAPLEALKKATAEYIKNNPMQLSFAALYVRDPETSDYTTGKVLYAYSMTGLTANLNGSASWNRNQTSAAGTALRKLREYSVEGGANTPTLSNVDYSTSVKWARDKAADAKSVIVGEAKAQVHIGDMFRLPISITYANRETEKIKKGWQMNFGLGALLDDVMRQFKAGL